MTNKELLLNILTKAKEDYGVSLFIPRGLFSFPGKTYRRLNTNLGLCHYFQKTHNVCNLLDMHLLRFKPSVTFNGYWYVKGEGGLESRLRLIDEALQYYQEAEEDTVPLVLQNSYIENTLYYNAYENGSARTPETLKVYNYFVENYDDILDASFENEKRD